MPATVSDRRSLPAEWSQSSAHPMPIMMKLRNASALTKRPPHFRKVGEDAGQLVGGYHLLVDGILQHLRLLCGHEA